MRVHRLEIEGFGPFRDQQVVDFDAVSHDGVFLIGGKTGAGKSSILDAICFALYGSVPRYDDGDKRLRSDYAALDEPTRVSLEFSSAGRTWRVERVPSYERLKKSGKGTTISPAEARLSERQGSLWVDVAARAVDVAHALDPVLGLTKDQFLQVILLAQGRFQEFLHAHNADRQKLLRTLFGTHRFSAYEQILDERRRTAVEALTLERRTLTVQLESAERLIEQSGIPVLALPESANFDERAGAVHTASLHAAHESEVAAASEVSFAAHRAAAEGAHSLLVRQLELQDTRDRTRAELAELESRAPVIAADRVTFARARDAEGLRAVIDVARRADRARATAEEASVQAHVLWAEAGEQPTDLGALDRRINDTVAQLGGWAGGAEAEASQPARTARINLAAAVVADLDLQREDLRELQSDLPALIESLRDQLSAASTAAALREPAEAITRARRAQRDAAQQAETAQTAVAAATLKAREAGQALTAALAELDNLRERRFRDHAGELAEQLVDGMPCGVCGSLSHPRPATRQDDPVTADDLSAADAAKSRASVADAEASEALRVVDKALAAAEAAADGLSVAEAETRLQEAVVAETQAHEAAREHTRLLAEHNKQAGVLEGIAAQLRDIDDQRAQAAQELAIAQEAERAALQSISDARGDFSTVAERITAAEATVALARALAEAMRAHEAAVAAFSLATADLDAALAATMFTSAHEATAALLSTAERSRLEKTVRDHEDAITSCHATLLNLELEALPEEEVSTVEAAAALTEATGAWRASVTRLAESRTFAEQIVAASEAVSLAGEAIAAASEDAQIVEELANNLAGRAPNTMKMNLETFVLAAELERIVEAANVRLSAMSEGRYALEHSDALAARNRASGLGITIMDRYTGQSRPVQSLSGGETFLASLALALGLASVVTSDAGGIQLDTLFIDEGFGSLDRDTLDVAMRTLDELRAGGRTVGIISHVEAMQEDLPAGLIVEATPEGPSVIRLGAQPA